LGPILFIIYINDHVEHVNNGSDLYLYADDAKLFSFIKTIEDSATLQKDLNSLTQWMETWLLKLNIGKCKAISYSRRPGLNRVGVKCEVIKCEVPVRGINARRWVICEAGMCAAQRTTGTAGVVGCEPLKRN